MVIDGKPLVQPGFQPVTRSGSDAYEVYWSSTEEESPPNTERRLYSCSTLPQSCRPGEAYSELWQLWDAR